MYTIGQIARQFGLSRSTLIYYDTKGLLKPSGRTDANYRMYSKSDIEKLERIILFRNAGMPLAAIEKMTNKSTDEVELALENRLIAINKEIQALRNQQQVILDIINTQGAKKNTRLINKKQWVDLLRVAGLDDEGMKNWHIEFERSSPEAHQDFLESIGINSEEIASIREWSKSAY